MGRNHFCFEVLIEWSNSSWPFCWRRLCHTFS